MNVNELVRGTQGKLRSQIGTNFSEIVTDSRKDVRGKIFIALKGDTHDGHKFLRHVIENGASAVVSHEWQPEYIEFLTRTTWVQVDDTLKALQRLAQYWRQQG
ncbi:hypothetical protein K2X05_10015, partial [bacterium]|nr:hypothetical protein [bacterium]